MLERQWRPADPEPKINADAPPCNQCHHFKGTITVLFVPIKTPHPRCAAVLDPGTGEPEFTEIQRMELYRGPRWPKHCGPEGKFFSK